MVQMEHLTMTYIAKHHPHLNFLMERTALPMPAQLAITFAVVVTKWRLRQRTRQQLGKLDAYILKDIGVSEDQARHESTLPFWRP